MNSEDRSVPPQAPPRTADDSAGPKPPSCAIVLVCWNNKAYLGPCLRSLFGAGMRNSFEVVAVDNGSTDGSQDMLRAEFPQIRIVQNERNLGLARACNQGVECTTAPYVLLLNNDTLVNGPALDALIDCMRSTPDAGAVGLRLLNEDGSFQAGCNAFSSLGQEFLIATRLGEMIWAGYPAREDRTAPKCNGWLSSACLLLRRDTLKTVGLLDEEYFIYGDEADLQLRMARAGWSVYYLKDSTITHFGGRSMDRWRRRRMVYRGKLLFYRKNYGAFNELLLRGMLFALTATKVGLWSLAWPLPGVRERAQRELRSNGEVIRLCFKPE